MPHSAPALGPAAGIPPGRRPQSGEAPRELPRGTFPKLLCGAAPRCILPAYFYYFADHLGTSRVIIQAGQTTPCYDADFYPFGGERTVTDTCPQPYKFTGKERDTESGLDYLAARYYGSNTGRFVSTDPLGGHAEDPQTLNRYAYVRNNPLSLTDPTGLDFYLQCTSEDHSGCTQVQIDPNNSKSTQWVQADKDGNATVITSDSIRGGQNTATMSENGLQINGNNQGIYFDNPASHSTDTNGHDVNRNTLDIAGSGELKGFNFLVNGNCGGTCLSSGDWSSNLTYGQARETLNAHSFTIPFENVRSELGAGEHPYSTQFRFGGSMFGCAVSSCPNTPHISVPFDPSGSYPKYTVPASGGWHVDAHSGWWAHGQDVQKTH